MGPCGDKASGVRIEPPRTRQARKSVFDSLRKKHLPLFHEIYVSVSEAKITFPRCQGRRGGRVVTVTGTMRRWLRHRSRADERHSRNAGNPCQPRAMKAILEHQAGKTKFGTLDIFRNEASSSPIPQVIEFVDGLRQNRAGR